MFVSEFYASQLLNQTMTYVAYSTQSYAWQALSNFGIFQSQEMNIWY